MCGRKSVEKDLPGFLRQQNVILSQLFSIVQCKLHGPTLDESAPSENEGQVEKCVVRSIILFTQVHGNFFVRFFAVNRGISCK